MFDEKIAEVSVKIYCIVLNQRHKLINKLDRDLPNHCQTCVPRLHQKDGSHSIKIRRNRDDKDNISAFRRTILRS